MISFGYSDDEIITYVTDRYGNDSSYEPNFSENIVLWLLPLIFLFFCFIGFYLKGVFNCFYIHYYSSHFFQSFSIYLQDIKIIKILFFYSVS
ncbi:MAG: hypothetical protein CM15mP127_08300 [Gammaproteobacteria bacterium]|nr:MAG: hypothetical protein CM15mP127_08300 [Gammaproteobacteria bacterium]